MTLCSLLVLRLLEKPTTGKRIPTAKRLGQVALPLALADDLKTGINTVENLMVPKRLGLYPGTADPLAAFGTVCGMVFPVLMFPAAILFGLAELLIPELARCAAAQSRGRIRYLVRRSLRISFLYGCLICGGMYLLSDGLCMGIYGNPEAGIWLRRFSLMIPMLYCDAIIDAMTKGLGQQKDCVRYNILTSALDVATERQVLRSIIQNHPNKTCIVTTHRPSVLNMCQRVYRVMDTRVTELSEEESSRIVMEF